MDETMNNVGTELTEVSEAEEVTQGITIDEASGPSKGFIALVAGGIAAVAIGATIAIKRHKKKKKAAAEQEYEFEDEPQEVKETDEETITVKDEEVSAKEEKSEEKPAGKK